MRTKKHHVQIHTENLKEQYHNELADDIIALAKRSGYDGCRNDRKGNRVRIFGETFTMCVPTKYNHAVKLINDTKKFSENIRDKDKCSDSFTFDTNDKFEIKEAEIGDKSVLSPEKQLKNDILKKEKNKKQGLTISDIFLQNSEEIQIKTLCIDLPGKTVEYDLTKANEEKLRKYTNVE